MDYTDIAIVGGGLAAAATAESYRKAGGTGSVAILTQEPDLPVHRPPLSKEYLRGDEALEKVFVHQPAFYRENDITVYLERRVESVDLDARRLEVAGGGQIGYGTLVLATGARPRRLSVPGSELEGIYYLRSLRSAQALQSAYAGARRAVIIGAGFIGMEVAATLTQHGIECTVVEMGRRVWPGLVPEVTSAFIRRYFESRGVHFRLEAAVDRLEGQGRVERVILADGTTLDADLVVAGVGAVLNTELAERAGLPVDRGVVVDTHFRTPWPDVYAVGDIASFPDPIAGRIHLEHWDHALNSGRALGKTLAGQGQEFRHVAYFFSDLFDLSLNMVGYPSGWDDVHILGDPASARFTTVYLKDGAVRGALMINDDAEFDRWTESVEARRPLSEMALHRVPLTG